MFAAYYPRWNLRHAIVVSVLALAVASGYLVDAAPAVALGAAAAAALALWSSAALLALYRAGRRGLPGRMGSGVSNLLTASRGACAVGLFVLVAVRPELSPARSWMLVTILGLVELSDFLDGFTARRAARDGVVSDFGPTWDMEHDALFTLAISLVLVVFYAVPAPVLAIGLMRYLYVVACRVDGDPLILPRAYKLFAKTVAASIVITGIVTLAPIIPGWLRLSSLSVVLLLQTVSFGWDWILQRRSRPAVVVSGAES